MKPTTIPSSLLFLLTPAPLILATTYVELEVSFFGSTVGIPDSTASVQVPIGNHSVIPATCTDLPLTARNATLLLPDPTLEVTCYLLGLPCADVVGIVSTEITFVKLGNPARAVQCYPE
ncbi:uncharacterized protein BP01DRAFT_5062 [Aspergillus saccharolyticus JOP 1030-1]|uniref:Uncharacterized protein n=1 Tax=Aspergillus saccharolyticus JOP 1030-1 TaxID=1450539 RepID=A0A318ZZW0_9EURO|nr:hypothetical protein BP01DRAFT_5062 [Aspergillus saccharolyticus JOP 1030-1]PYH49760.1 hypothetical protein BP01DRAFT_5062 [Aspergillus saccharolyticus JOP 1030-1]